MTKTLKDLINDSPYIVCVDCKGNGYLRLNPSDIRSATKTCVKCGGAGHFKRNKSNITSSNDTAINMLNLIDYLYGQKRRTN
jgi:DnaJ-class molecular chaperone